MDYLIEANMGIFDEYEEYDDPEFKIKTEEDEDFDEENSLLLATLDWAPMPETVSWKDPNFSKDIVSRLKGVTEDSFTKEVQIWQDAIGLLPYYDEIEIRRLPRASLVHRYHPLSAAPQDRRDRAVDHSRLTGLSIHRS